MNQLFEYHLEPAQITTPMYRYWRVAANWAIFLSIVGFAGIFLNLIYTFAIGVGAYTTYNAQRSFMEQSSIMPSMGIYAVISVFSILIFFILQFFKYFYQIRFAATIKHSIQTESQEKFEAAWQNLRNSFRMAAILILLQILLLFAFLYHTMNEPNAFYGRGLF